MLRPVNAWLPPVGLFSSTSASTRAGVVVAVVGTVVGVVAGAKVGCGDRLGIGEVCLEHRAHLRRQFEVGDAHGDLEVQAERAVVEIRRADRAVLVIDERDFLMHESARVLKEPDADPFQLVEIESAEP